MPTSTTDSKVGETKGSSSTPKSPGRAVGNPVPKWIPITMITLSTAALIVPIFILRRQRAGALVKSLRDNPGPRRRSGIATKQFAQPSKSLQSPSTLAPSNSTPKGEVEIISQLAGDHFNAPLYTAKAFGFATLLVGIGAATSIWGVKAYMGVQDTKEFADRMRSTLLTQMPVLSARIYGPPGQFAEHPDNLPSISHLKAHRDTHELEWNWPDSEKRLKEAFDKDGCSGWAGAVLREVEMERQVERIKRGYVQKTENSR